MNYTNVLNCSIILAKFQPTVPIEMQFFVRLNGEKAMILGEETSSDCRLGVKAGCG